MQSEHKTPLLRSLCSLFNHGGETSRPTPRRRRRRAGGRRRRLGGVSSSSLRVDREREGESVRVSMCVEEEEEEAAAAVALVVLL